MEQNERRHGADGRGQAHDDGVAQGQTDHLERQSIEDGPHSPPHAEQEDQKQVADFGRRQDGKQRLDGEKTEEPGNQDHCSHGEKKPDMLPFPATRELESQSKGGIGARTRQDDQNTEAETRFHRRISLSETTYYKSQFEEAGMIADPPTLATGRPRIDC